MTRMLPYLVAALALGAPLSSGPRDEMLATPQWLAQHLKDANLVVLHVGEKADYDTAHIPGARHVSLRAVSREPAGPLALEMPSVEDLRGRLEALGISDDSRIVVYSPKGPIQSATRVIFTLLHAGLTNVRLLDGGLEAWKQAGHPVTSDVPPARTGRLTRVEPRANIVDADFVREHVRKSGFAVIDARDAVFYDGTREGGPADRRTAGHIAGARSIPFSTLTTANLKLKPQSELEAIFTAAGVKPGDTVITYCHIGQQATAVLFAARSIGHKVLLYDGSFEDWVRRGLPVEK